MNKKPKILVFIDWYIPAFKAGGPIRSISNLVEALGSEYDFYIVTGDRDLGEGNVLKGIQVGQWCEVGKAKVLYLTNEQQTKQRFQEVYEELTPDFIYLNSLFSKKFTLLPLSAFKKIKNKIILAPRGMFGSESLKIKSLKKKVFLNLAKFSGLFKGITWHASSDLEKKEIINQIGGNALIKIASNLPYLPSEVFPKKKKVSGQLSLISVGRIVPIKNIKYKLDELSMIHDIEIEAKFIGPIEDEEYFKECREIVAKLPSNIKVEFIKGVNYNELASYYRDADVYFSSTLNENFGHGIVESMGFSCPVIISQHTPWRELEGKKIGFDLPLIENAFAEKISFFGNMEENEFEEYRKNSRQFAEDILKKSEILEANRRLFQKA